MTCVLVSYCGLDLWVYDTLYIAGSTQRNESTTARLSFRLRTDVKSLVAS